MVNENKKWCSGCKAFHQLRAFDKNSALADGLQTLCREYQKKKRRQKSKENKKHWKTNDPYKGTK